MMVYQTSVSHFKVKNTPLNDTDAKGKFKRMLSFVVVDNEGFSIQIKLSFEEFEIFFKADRSAWPFLKRNQASKLLKNFQG